MPPAHHLGIEPGGLDRIGTPCFFASHQEVAAALAKGAVGRNLEASREGALNDFGIDTDPLGLRQDLRRFGPVFRMLDELGGFHRRAHQAGDHVRILVGPDLAERQHLLRRMGQDVGDEMQDVADAEVDRDRIPGRADAERIDLAAGQGTSTVQRNPIEAPRSLGHQRACVEVTLVERLQRVLDDHTLARRHRF